MVTVEFPKEPCKKIKYKDIKNCTLKRESGELTEECRKIFSEGNIHDD